MCKEKQPNTSDQASKCEGQVDGSFFILQAFQEQFEKMDSMFGEIRDQMDR